jgi:hypothetical protein
MADPPNSKRIELAPIIPRKTAWVIGGLTLVFLLSGAMTMWQSYAERKRLATTSARIAYSEIVSFGEKAKPSYRLQVEFLYAVDGERLRVPYSFPYHYADRKSADSDAMVYRVRSTHPIYYDPRQPYNMIVNPASSSRFFVSPLLLTLFGIIFGGSLFFMYLKSSAYFCMACGSNVKELHAFCYHCGRRIPARKGKLRT